MKDRSQIASAHMRELSQDNLIYLPIILTNYQEIYCSSPYMPDSIWNTPIDWSEAKIHPQNAAMMNAFFSDDRWIGANTSMYTPNIYFVNNDTPFVPVTLYENRFRDAISDRYIEYGEPGGTVWMPLPEEARPAPGLDGQLVVINLDTGEEWGMNNAEVDSAGNWYAGGAYRYHIENSGIPPEGFGQRGGGITQFAGIVRPCEINRGYIGHAVTIAYDYPCAPDVCEANDWPVVIPPFKKTDGHGNAMMDIPEGARLIIRPEISNEEISNACSGIKGCVIWALNMQTFGGFIVDNSDHPKTYAEGNTTANWSSEIWTNDMLRNIPPDWYAILDWKK